MQTEDTTELTAEQVEALVADAPSPDGGGAFTPTDEGGVNWVLKKMADAHARAERIRVNAEKMARAEERDAEYLLWKYGPALQTWLRAELDGGSRKSKQLVHGRLGFRQKPAGICVTNAAAALSWAKERLPAAVTERLDKAVLADTLLTTGESVQWAQIVPTEEVFYIK